MSLLVRKLLAQPAEVSVVKIIECPRDAWQALPTHIPRDVKAAYLRELVETGFQHIDAVSFVSPTAVPQMADSEAVLHFLKPPAGVEIIGIVANLRGAERAIATRSVQTLGFPYSISPRFLARNQHQTQVEALHTLVEITDLAYSDGLDVVAYISMAFGNPYGDPWSPQLMVDACGLLADVGVKTISLADTVGLASPQAISDTVGAAIASYDDVEFGAHLHARAGEGAALIEAAYAAGCRRFDSAVGGLGGCPFAQDDLVGNIATELLLQTLKDIGADVPEIGPLNALIKASAEIAHGSVSIAR